MIHASDWSMVTLIRRARITSMLTTLRSFLLSLSYVISVDPVRVQGSTPLQELYSIKYEEKISVFFVETRVIKLGCTAIFCAWKMTTVCWLPGLYLGPAGGAVLLPFAPNQPTAWFSPSWTLTDLERERLLPLLWGEMLSKIVQETVTS